MKVTYESQTKLVYIALKEIGAGEVAHTCLVECDEIKGSVHLDVDKHGRLVAVEVLGGGRAVPQEVLDIAERT